MAPYSLGMAMLAGFGGGGAINDGATLFLRGAHLACVYVREGSKTLPIVGHEGYPWISGISPAVPGRL